MRLFKVSNKRIIALSTFKGMLRRNIEYFLKKCIWTCFLFVCLFVFVFCFVFCCFFLFFLFYFLLLFFWGFLTAANFRLFFLKKMKFRDNFLNFYYFEGKSLFQRSITPIVKVDNSLFETYE